MALINSTFEQHTWIRNCYWIIENVTEVQKHERNEFGTPPPTRVMVTKIHNKLQVSWKRDRAKGEYGVSTKITRRNAIRLFPVGCSKECCLHLKTTYTARPEA
jgi:hypothetical protein